MRITTQMINESARKAGLPLQQSTLLDYVNNDSSITSTGDTLLDALNKKNVSSDTGIGTGKKSDYEELEKQSGAMMKVAEELLAQKDSVFAKAKESGDTSGVCSSVEKLVEKYNATVSSLKKTSGSLNKYYQQMLEEAAASSSKEFEELGVTVGKDGKISVDKEKLAKASVDDIEKVFGNVGGFTNKVAFLASRIEDNAKASAESLSSKYSASGKAYSMGVNQYDFWG